MKNIVLLSAFMTLSCSAPYNLPKTDDPYFQNAHPCKSDLDNRIGCLCNDSTYSKATGSGACSHHGGVKVWLCK